MNTLTMSFCILIHVRISTEYLLVDCLGCDTVAMIGTFIHSIIHSFVRFLRSWHRQSVLLAEHVKFLFFLTGLASTMCE